MSPWRLVLRSLVHYRRTGLVVVASLAVASAVITGSLLVGASVTGSLRDTALSRLGRVRHALVAPHFFRAALARDLESGPPSPPNVGGVSGGEAAGIGAVVPAILTQGAASHAETGAAVPHVSVVGVDDGFARLFEGESAPPGPPNVGGDGEGRDGHALSLGEGEVAINEALARDLGLRAGDALLLNLDVSGTAPSGTLFAERKRERTTRSVRLDVAKILPDAGMGAFRLDANPATPRNLFLPREMLARELGREGRANALLADSETDDDTPLEKALASRIRLEDYGLSLKRGPLGEASLYGAEVVLPEAAVSAAEDAAKKHEMHARRVSINLATTIRGAGRSIAYVMLAGVDPGASFRFVAGGGKPLDREGIWLNRWAAEDLRAHTGETLEVTTLVPSWEGEYREEKHRFVLRGIVTMEGLGADPGLVPPITGITDADRVDAWDAPFPVDLKRVTPRDEEYWERYRAAPRAFVALETARELWLRAAPSGESDWVTTVRLSPEGAQDTDPDALATAMLAALQPWDAGMTFRPVRKNALNAAQGSTDFGQLFLALSFFLVLSAAGLAGMTMRLLADRRAAETGILLATGFRERGVRGAVLREGAILALLGGLAGVPLGLLYAWALVHALATRWIGALGTPSLSLHVEVTALAAGGIAGIAVGVLSAWWGSQQIARRPVLELLSGWQAMDVLKASGPARRSGIAAAVMAVLATGLLTAGGTGAIATTGAFFAGGAALLAAGLFALQTALRQAMGRPVSGPTPSLAALAVRGAAASPGRSLLIAGLFACAAFVLIAVAANRRDASAEDVLRKDSGAGGFALRAVASLPIGYDFGSPEGRERLGFPPEDEALFQGVTIIPFLMSRGDDISCLNPTRPSAPRLLGVPAAMIERGGFRVVGPAGKEAAPWEALRGEAAGGAVPAFGDADSVMWTLHSGAGKLYRVPTDGGKETDLHLAGLLPGSVFAGELLVHEERFRGLFPSAGGPRYFLIATPPGAEEEVAEALRRNLGDLGLEVRSTQEILTSLKGVQNTYLSAFLALGGLGLLLGTFGLVSAMLRSVLERRGELAMMLAMGFRPNALARLLVLENAGLLAVGMAWGTACALLAVAPTVSAAGARVPWAGLLGLLAAMAALGLASCAVTARSAAGEELVAALREG